MRPVIALLLAAVLAACGWLAYLWVDPESGEPRSFAWTRPEVVRPDLPALSKRPEAMLPSGEPTSYGVMVERPLFAPDRRPPPPPKPVVEAPPDPLDKLELRGVFSGDVSGVLAGVDGRNRRVKVGDKVGDWTLSEVNERVAQFVRGEEKRSFRLAFSKWGVAPARVASVRSGGPANPQAPANEAERIRMQQDEIAERERLVNEIRARAGMLRP